MMAKLNQALITQALAENLDMVLEVIEMATDRAMTLHGFEFAHEDEHNVMDVGDFTDKQAHQAAYHAVLDSLGDLLPTIAAIIAKHNAPFLLRETTQDEIEAALLNEVQA